MQNEKIVITKTPLRVSFVGGGTDMPYFYNKFFGATISCAINRYVYVTAKFHNNFQEKYRLNYSETESVNSINEIKNLRIKEVIKVLKIKKPLYINTFADIPANSGLGSSSSFTVGLINALSRLQKKKLSLKKIAELAYKIEAKITGNSLGKQDHYIAAFGGFKHIQYRKNKIIISSINLSKKNLNLFLNSLLLIWTKQHRSADNILKDQKKNKNKNYSNLNLYNNLTKSFLTQIIKKNINIKTIGEITLNSWKLKKSFSKLISNTNIENIFKKIKNNIYGGKLLGAGTGGWILVIFNKKNKKKLLNILKSYKCLNIALEEKGSKELK